MSCSFSCDVKASRSLFPHFWEHTVGSGHATLALRADWQAQMKRCHAELGFLHVRFHGILSDDMGTLMCENEKLVYSFFNADQIMDFLVSIGMTPFVEFSFMPTTLSSGNEIVFKYKGNITPPRDYNTWVTLIKKLVQHWVDRYGLMNVQQWFFEVWNEPNLSAFWTGSQQEYFKLYQLTSDAIKSINEHLVVGGPATASNAWIPEFSTFCDNKHVAYDFISTHHYPTDAFGQPGDDTVTQLADSTRSILRDQVVATRKQAKDKPVYYTEWSTSSNPFDELHDLPYAAAFITKTIMEARGNIQGYSYWTFSDIFEENYFSSAPFHGGFGLMSIYGIPKPSYRAFQLLHRLGTEILYVSGEHPTVDVWVTGGVDSLTVLITNSALPRHPVQNEEIDITLCNISLPKNVYIERIDDTHANPRVSWMKMGSPDSLTPDQVIMLENVSTMVKERLDFKSEDGNVIMKVTIPPQGTALITLEH